MIDAEFAERYKETWEKAFLRGSSIPEELDRAHMLLTKERKRALIEGILVGLAGEQPQVLAARIGVPLESATFSDGVRAAIAWMQRQAKEQP